jgi:hypothetical protein
MEVKNIIGAKYYSYDYDGTEPVLKVKRLFKIKNSNKFSMIDETGKTENMTKSEFNKWIKIIPHGYISFSIVDMNGYPDVIITLVKTEDVISIGEYTPHVICRQQMFNPMSNYPGGVVSLGLNKAGANFMNEHMACSSVNEVYTVAVYRDDKIEDILKYIPKVKFDSALYHLKHETPIGLGKFYKPLEGFCDALSELIKFYDFESYFYECFGIERYSGTITLDEIGVINATNSFKEQFGITDVIINPIVTPYNSLEIDLSKIKRNYHILVDNTNTLYILIYSTR